MKDTWRARLKPLEVEIRTISTLIVFGVHIAPSIFRDGELRQPGKHSRHHTKDKQRLVLSVVAYDSLPGHHPFLLTNLSVVRFLFVLETFRDDAV